ncbi:MAG: TonB-dependent receptor [Ignavibacteriae bacterium]|nr:TonB-dependent receptor [Ignavibacteriota bacterium]
MPQTNYFKSALMLLLFVISFGSLFAQGVTTSSINGIVTDGDGNPLPGANVIAVHTPSGTTYGASTRLDGRFFVAGMRVGGPYKVTASYVGFKEQVRDNVYLNLGVSSDVNFNMVDANIELGEVVVAGERDAIFSSERTGAATAINKEAIKTLPTITGRIGDFARLTPQFSRAGVPDGSSAQGFSFAGQDNRYNNISVDGSYFNNSFGLAGQPGDRTGVAPISMDAIEQLQINIAPYDVRQGNFVGAGVNTVTRSGTNDFSGTAYYKFRDDGLVGTKAGDLDFNPGTFNYSQVGLSLGGPIIKNKLFFFMNFENEALTNPATTFEANAGGQEVVGNTTRVLASDLDNLSSFLKQNFDYETGPYQGYDFETPATRFIAKLDYNLDDNNKLSLRYTHLDSETDVLMSNSSSLGFGNRRTNSNSMNYANSNYSILENIRSIVGEWNARIGDNMANNLIVGYTYQDESRGYKSDKLFPMVDILKDGANYISFGFEPFTPNNELRYKSFQLQNNFSIYGADHNFTFGASLEYYESENIFFPGSQSVYVYNSLDDFYADANAYINGTASPTTVRRFQVRWSNQPGMDKPVQPLEVTYAGIYGQDDWHLNKDFKLTMGLRIDVPFFGNTGFENSAVDNLNFQDEEGNTVKYSTSKLPDPNPLFSPRIGFNWDLNGDKTTQLRGGTGIFTGRPAYVWVSNQIGNNGVLTGFEQQDNTTARPFNPDPDHYKPTSVTGDPASSYELAFTDQDFKFPQIWRSNFAVDQKLPLGLIGTAEAIYGKDVNGVYYINANLADPNTAFNGVDSRARWTSGNRINSNISSAIVLKNQNEGSSLNLSASLEKPFSDNWFAKVAYNYGYSENTVDAGSIAFGSWNNNQHSNDPNNPGIAYSNYSPGHRIFAAAAYRLEYFDFGATTFSFFWDGYTPGNASYVFSGDINGDGGTSNDLIYIANDKSEMNFVNIVDNSNNVLFTADQQAEAWDAYIEQDDYLSENRGEYAERGGAFLPMVFRADFSVSQEVFADLLGARNSLQFRVDFLNFGNLLNPDWGVNQRFTTTTPLVVVRNAQANAEGEVQYQLTRTGGNLITESFTPTASIDDVFRIQLSVRYTFN